MSEGIAALLALTVLLAGDGLALLWFARRIARSIRDLRGSAREPRLAVQVVGGLL